MFTLFFWLFIALLGLLLYISPAFYIRRPYEPFENNMPEMVSSGMPAVAGGSKPRPSSGPSPIVMPALPEGFENAPSSTVSAAPRQTESVPAILGPMPETTASPNVLSSPQQMSDLLKNMELLITPNLEIPEQNMPSPTASAATITAVGAKAQPTGADSNKSEPAEAKVSFDTQESLKQGEAFKKTIPKAPEPRVIIKEVPAKCPPAPKCPPQRICPTCPDMSGYIRKDSIPCWNCKLG